MTEITGFADFGVLPPPPGKEVSSDLAQEDFLTLMITQFQNQDPFEPMDNGDFLGQLAQFGTVNGIEQLNSSFVGLQNSIQSEQALQAANLVGHPVLATTDTGFLEDGMSLSGAVELDSSASDVQIDITDMSGGLVRRLELGSQASGLARFEWDGNDLNGERVAPGHYQVSSRVIRGGYVESAETLMEADIESVSLGSAGQGLTLNMRGGDTLSLNQVRRIL